MLKTFNGMTPRIDETVYIAETAIVIGDVVIGKNSSVWFGCTLRGDVNSIRIGERTNVQDNSVIHVSSKDHATTLEDEVTIGHGVTLHGCYIETGSLIGIGAIVLDGVRVGRDSLVAAGSLVTPGTQIPPRSLVRGSPARVKRPLTEEELAGLPKFWQNYIALSASYLAS